MPHSTVALPDDDPRAMAFRHIMADNGTVTRVSAQADVHVRSVELIETREPGCAFPSPAFKLTGEVMGFTGDFPGGIRTISYPRPQVSDQDAADAKQLLSCSLPRVTYIHRLTPAEKVELVRLGLMESGFAVPQQVRDNVYQLPIDIDVRTLSTDLGPITSVDVASDGAIQTSTADDGYQLLSYFEQLAVMRDEPSVVHHDEVEEQPIDTQHVDEDDLLFADAEGLAPDVAPEPEAATDDADDELGEDVFADEDDAAADRSLVDDVFSRVVLGAGESVSSHPETAGGRPEAEQPQAQAQEQDQTQDQPQEQGPADATDDDELGDLLFEDEDDDEERHKKATKNATARRIVKESDRDDAVRRALADGHVDASEQAEIEGLSQ